MLNTHVRRSTRWRASQLPRHLVSSAMYRRIAFVKDTATYHGAVRARDSERTQNATQGILPAVSRLNQPRILLEQDDQTKPHITAEKLHTLSETLVRPFNVAKHFH